MKQKISLLIFLILTISTYSFGQAQTNTALGSEIFTGFILKHKSQIGHLITSHPNGFSVSFERKTYGKEQWQQRYNYPDIGGTLTYVNYGDQRLGKTFSLIPHYSFYVRKNKTSPNQLKYTAGIGLAYNSQKYDRETNNKNNVLSTDLSIGVLIQLAYQWQFTPRCAMRTSLGLTHFSNGAFKRPNAGINVISSNLGFSYLLNYSPAEYQSAYEEPFGKPEFGYTLTFSSGIHEYARIGTGQYPFFVTTAIADLQVNYKSAVGIAAEWFASFSMKHDIAARYEFHKEKMPDWHRVGIALSHELFINKMSVITQAGYYLYDEFNYYGKIYLRLGLRKYLNNKIFGAFSVKTHAAKAEAAELSLGWRIK